VGRTLGHHIEVIQGKYKCSLITLLKDKLYWISDAQPPKNIPNAFFFNIDNDLTYSPFNADFGPLNLANVHRYCRELQKLLQQQQYQGSIKIYHYTKASNDFVKMTNSAFLIAAFMVVILGQSAS
jgi:cell division cycle 14